MVLPINIQYNIIIFSLLGGVLTGVLFDGYRLIRGVGIPRAIVVLEDLLFGVLCGLIVFIFLLYTNYAFLGFYVYIGIVVGFMLYIRTLSSMVLKLERNGTRKINKGWRIVFKNISYVFKIILYKLLGKNK